MGKSIRKSQKEHQAKKRKAYFFIGTRCQSSFLETSGTLWTLQISLVLSFPLSVQWVPRDSWGAPGSK